MSSRYATLLFFAAALLAVHVHPASAAQAAAERLISGTVTNASTHTPIGAAVVTTADRQAVTGPDGQRW